MFFGHIEYGHTNSWWETFYIWWWNVQALVLPLTIAQIQKFIRLIFNLTFQIWSLIQILSQWRHKACKWSLSYFFAFIVKRFHTDNLSYLRVEKVTCSQKQSGWFDFNIKGNFEARLAASMDWIYTKPRESRKKSGLPKRGCYNCVWPRGELISALCWHAWYVDAHCLSVKWVDGQMIITEIQIS